MGPKPSDNIAGLGTIPQQHLDQLLLLVSSWKLLNNTKSSGFTRRKSEIFLFILVGCQSIVILLAIQYFFYLKSQPKDLRTISFAGYVTKRTQNVAKNQAKMV